MSRMPLRLVLVLFACSTALLSQKALTAEDVITLPRVGDPQISPDGSVVAYVVGEPSLETNKVVRHIWLVATDGKSEPKQITKGDGETDPRWSPDGKTIAFIAKKDGVPQIHLMSADGSGARALTSLSTGAGGPVWSPDGTKIAFTSEVWPQLADDAAQKAEADRKEKEGVKAMVFTGLLYRHWNSYNDGKRSQLFVADVKDGKTTQLTKEARDVPPFSLGGPPDYAFSADSGKVYFTRGPAAGARGLEHERGSVRRRAPTGGEVTSLTAEQQRLGRLAVPVARRQVGRVPLAGARRLRERPLPADAAGHRDRTTQPAAPPAG